MKADLDSSYPPGHFFAFDDGQLVADAASYNDLTDALISAGKNRIDIFVVRSGIDYPEQGIILAAACA